MRRNYNGLLFYKHTDKEVLVYFPTRGSALRCVSPKSKGKSGLGLEAQRAAIQRFAEAEGITLIAEHLTRKFFPRMAENRLPDPSFEFGGEFR